MRHKKRGRKLNRTASHKKAMLNNMATSLFDHGSIRTTYAKAKELRSLAERMITFAKRGDLHARRRVLRRIRNPVVVSKLFDEIGPAFAERNGGYTRVLKLGPRWGDRVEVCVIELVGDEFRSEYAERSSSRDAAAGPAEPLEEEAAEEEETSAEEEDEVLEEAEEDEASEEAEEDETDSGEKEKT